MASSPNYYYNSPYIADAARNLASALAPPDAEKQLAVQQAQFEFDQAQEKDIIERRTRQAREAANTKVRELLEMQPVVGPDGEVDEDATELKARGLFGQIVELGGVEDYYKPADLAAGTASPAYAVKSGLRQQSIDAARQNMISQFAQALTMQGNLFGHQRGMQDDSQEFTAQQQKERLDAATEREWIRYQRDMDKAAATNKAGGGPVPVVSGQFQKDILRGVIKKVQDNGGRMSRPNFDSMVALAGKYAQESRNAQEGVNRAWAETVEDDTYISSGAADVNKPRGFFNFGGQGTRYIKPTFEEPAAAPAPAAEAPRTLVNALDAPPSNYVEFGARERAMEDEVRDRDRASIATPPAPAPATKPPQKSAVPMKTINGEARPAPRSRAERDSLQPGTPYWGPNGEDLTVKGR